MITKQWNGKHFRPVQTVQEAEQFLGKKVIGGRQNIELESRIIINHIKKFENERIAINKMTPEIFFQFNLESGQPCGIEFEPEFKLPELTGLEESSAEICGLTKNELRIIKYIRQNYKEGNSIGIYFINNGWNYSTVYFSHKIKLSCGIDADELCKLLNDNNIKP
jgi:hypothetical protein